MRYRASTYATFDFSEDLLDTEIANFERKISDQWRMKATLEHICGYSDFLDGSSVLREEGDSNEGRLTRILLLVLNIIVMKQRKKLRDFPRLRQPLISLRSIGSIVSNGGQPPKFTTQMGPGRCDAMRCMKYSLSIRRAYTMSRVVCFGSVDATRYLWRKKERATQFRQHTNNNEEERRTDWGEAETWRKERGGTAEKRRVMAVLYEA